MALGSSFSYYYGARSDTLLVHQNRVPPLPDLAAPRLGARARAGVGGGLAAGLWRPAPPAWRRAAARAHVELRIAGGAPTEAPELVAGTTAPDHPPVLVIDETQALAAVASPGGLAAVWTSHPAIVALARGALGGAP